MHITFFIYENIRFTMSSQSVKCPAVVSTVSDITSEVCSCDVISRSA